MRRAYCEISDHGEISRILNSVHMGRLGTVGADGYPYITPVNFVFHKGAIYFHSAPEGEKLDNLKRDPRVCFQVDLPLAYLELSFNPERNPCRAHQLYHCVIVRGYAREVVEPELKAAVLTELVAKQEGHRDFEPVTVESSGFKGCCVVEIRPEKMSGKSDLLQNKPREGSRRLMARHLVRRGLPGDLEAVRAMGYEPREDGEID